MPYKRGPLDSSQVGLLKSWIDEGAPHPVNEEPSSDRHWSFILAKRPNLPSIADRAPGFRIRNSIDAFILNRLATEAIEPSGEADKPTLLRRVYLDLIGLPPAPEEIQHFLSDNRPNAYESVVEALLASPHYGERWGRWWLDGSRYADSNGYSIDSVRSIWPYRDWVVRALNADMPFDQFTTWQLAGDLLQTNDLPCAASSRDALIATGFHRNTQVNHEGGIDPEQFRVESVVDRVNTTATVWLGITLACAQCHDHKFDPFTQRDYYRFMAFFNSCENDGHGNSALEAENFIELSPAEEIAARDLHRAEFKRREKELSEWADQELKPRQREWEFSLTAEAKKKLTELVRDILEIPPDQRTKDQANLIWGTFRDRDETYKARRKELDGFRAKEPPIIKTLVMRERPEARLTRVLIKGDFTRPGDEVEPGVPEMLQAATFQPDPAAPTPPLTGGKNRLDLAQWITSPKNPLTARVLANRIWQQYFGKGLVETENDFGTMGQSPTHPDLLDWLATELVSRGWSLKALHRLIVTSSTYRQSSKMRPDLAERDPANRLLARQNRSRLDAEIVRDSALAASGLLDQRLGGPPVFPPQPEGLGSFTQNDRPWKPSKGANRYRRAIYTHVQRTTFHPALAVFDAPDGYQACTRRIRSNTPLQALTLLNDAAFHEIANELAERIQRDAQTDNARINRAFLLVLNRAPAEKEVSRVAQLLADERSYGSENDTWLALSRVLLNLDERITRE
jgi:hypothetical protein